MEKNKKRDMYTRKEEESGKRTVWMIGIVALLLAIAFIAIASFI